MLKIECKICSRAVDWDNYKEAMHSPIYPLKWKEVTLGFICEDCIEDVVNMIEEEGQYYVDMAREAELYKHRQ